jgi:hypothetical protein
VEDCRSQLLRNLADLANQPTPALVRLRVCARGRTSHARAHRVTGGRRVVRLVADQARQPCPAGAVRARARAGSGRQVLTTRVRAATTSSGAASGCLRHWTWRWWRSPAGSTRSTRPSRRPRGPTPRCPRCVRGRTAACGSTGRCSWTMTTTTPRRRRTSCSNRPRRASHCRPGSGTAWGALLLSCAAPSGPGSRGRARVLRGAIPNRALVQAVVATLSRFLKRTSDRVLSVRHPRCGLDGRGAARWLSAAWRVRACRSSPTSTRSRRPSRPRQSPSTPR